MASICLGLNELKDGSVSPMWSHRNLIAKQNTSFDEEIHSYPRKWDITKTHLCSSQTAVNLSIGLAAYIMSWYIYAIRHTIENIFTFTCVQKWNDMAYEIWYIQYIPRNMHTVFALLCFVVVIHWLIFPYPTGLLHWHCGNLTIAPVPAKQPWWIWINTSCEFILNDCITTTKQSTTKPCAYFLGYTVCAMTPIRYPLPLNRI